MGSLVVIVDQRTNGCVKPCCLFLARHQIQLSEVIVISKPIVSYPNMNSKAMGAYFIHLCSGGSRIVWLAGEGAIAGVIASW